MDRLVYLHELDSARNSSQEIAHARRALYEEIVLHGNTVVITFNQLADSRAFLGLAMESEEMLAVIKGLMLSGAIRISRFKDKRTASQYLQDSLPPTAAGSHGKFVFTGWNIPAALGVEATERIRDGIYRALRNSDTAYMDALLVEENADLSPWCHTGTTAVSAREYNDAINDAKRLVSLVLAVSNSPLAYVDANQEAHPDFSKVFDVVQSSCPEAVGQETWRLLEDVRGRLPQKDRCARSAHYRLLKVYAKGEGAGDVVSNQECAEEAIRVVDLCYNLTTEASVQGVSSHYDPADPDSLRDEVRERLESYRSSYEAMGHCYPWMADPGFQAGLPSVTVEDWQHALRIRTAATPRKTSEVPEAAPPSKAVFPYEAGSQEQDAVWKSRVTGALWRNILVMLLYAVVLGFVEVIVSLIQDMLVGWLNIGGDTIGDMVSDQGSIVSIFIFLVGIALLSRSKDSVRSRRVLVVFLAVLFFAALPVLSCVRVGIGTDGLFAQAHMEDLPTMLIMGVPSLVASFVGVGIFAYVGWIVESKLQMPGIIDSATAAWKSLKDLGRFGTEGAGERASYINANAQARYGEGAAEAIRPDAWEMAHGIVPQRMAAASDWERYLSAVADGAAGGVADPALRVVTDRAAVMQFEASAQGRPIGIAYSSPYNQLLVDLVEDGQGRRFAYERVLPTAKNAVVVIPRYDGKFVLLRQFRHALSSYQLGFPRGYGEPGISAQDNAEKELFEELRVHPVAPPQYLGSVVPDSGLSGGRAEVFLCDIPAPQPEVGYEEIDGFDCVSVLELGRLIKEGRIDDGFTLSALTLMRCAGELADQPVS